MAKFRKGDRVKILRKDCIGHGKLGFITNIDGEYHYVRLRWSKCEIELYRHEIEKA